MTSFNEHCKADAISFPLTDFIRKQTSKKNTLEVQTFNLKTQKVMQILQFQQSGASNLTTSKF